MLFKRWNIPLILKRMIEALLIVSPAIMIVMPILFANASQEFVDTYTSSFSHNRWLTLAFLEVCGALCWMVLLMLQRLLTTVIRKSPFEQVNVKYLKLISYFCAGAALVLIVKTIVDFSVLTPVVAVISLLASFFCQVLAAVFDKAIRIKNENDLTI